MPTPKTYLVSFSPAERTAHGFRTIYSLTTRNPDHEVTAATLPDLERQTRDLAKKLGQTCTPYVRLKNDKERKPPGFDAWRNTIRIIDVEPVAASTATA